MIFGDDESKVFHLFRAEVTFSLFGVKLVLTKKLKYCVDMFLVLYRILRVNQDIIKENKDKFMQVFFKKYLS